LSVRQKIPNIQHIRHPDLLHARGNEAVRDPLEKPRPDANGRRDAGLAAQTVGISLAELQAPFSNSVVSESHSPHRQDFFDIAKAQGESEIKPNTVTDDFGWKR